MTPEQLYRRDRLIVGAGLLGIAGLSWLYLLRLAADMAARDHPGMAMPQMAPWQLGDFLLTALMWGVMMMAMMIPSATPMILLFATVNRKRQAEGTPVVRTGLFLAGYVVVWSAYSLLAALAQGALHAAALVTGPALAAAPSLGGLLLVVAGVYQFTPLKDACLARCQSPIGFLLTEWREGPRGALVMGLRHGAFCVGCCWVLMALLFVLGVMNLLWVAALAGFVLLEKVVPRGRVVSWAGGALLLGWGGWLLARSL